MTHKDGPSTTSTTPTSGCCSDACTRAWRPKGVFVNADQVSGPTPLFDQLYASWQERDARRAGPDDVAWCGALEWMEPHRFAVMVARR
jgi:hypothetical protein